MLGKLRHVLHRQGHEAGNSEENWRLPKACSLLGQNAVRLRNRKATESIRYVRRMRKYAVLKLG